MKLINFITELEAKKGSALCKEKDENGFTVTSDILKNFEKSLFECEEFKNVARINYIDMPNYLVDEETGEPISANREFLGGNTQAKSVGLFRVNPNQELKFNKIVDLYSIRINKIYPNKENIEKPGVWVYPPSWDLNEFTSTNQIRIIWDPAQLQEALRMVGNSETPKTRLLRMFETALDNMEPNIPCEYVLFIRCSNRSISNADEHVVLDIQPSQSEEVTINLIVTPDENCNFQSPAL